MCGSSNKNNFKYTGLNHGEVTDRAMHRWKTVCSKGFRG